MIKPIVTNKKMLGMPSHPIIVCDEAFIIIKEVIQDLMDTAIASKGKEIGCAGLAANQIGHLHRIFLFWNGGDFTAVINPVIELRGTKTDKAYEGCLSRPGVRVEVIRHKKIKLRYLDENLEPKVRNFSQFPARVIQHETDHLNGKFI